jgi:hypothetical protein
MTLTQARFVAAVFYAVVLLVANFAHAQTKPIAPSITVYKTPT